MVASRAALLATNSAEKMVVLTAATLVAMRVDHWGERSAET